MKITGRRTDGALYLSIGAGHAVILRGDRVSSPQDESVIEKMGPWLWSPDDNTFDARQTAEQKLNAARVVTLNNFTLGAPPPWLDKKIEGEEDEGEAETGAPETDAEGLFVKKDEGGKPGTPPKKDGLFVKKEEAVALDDSIPAEKDKDKPAVSEIAQTAQAGKDAAPPPKETVINLPEKDAAAAVVTTDVNPVPSPEEDRKKKRGELRDKIRGAVKSQKKVEDVLGDEDISDDDLYAMAKALGVTGAEHPGVVKLVDNATRFQRLLSSTTRAKHLADDGGEHPFTYCKENVIPSMEAEGKAPDDPDAFCAWWKEEKG